MTDKSPKGSMPTQGKGKAIVLPPSKEGPQKALNAQEQRFADEYLIDLDVSRAALAAGYAESVAKSKAFQWVSSSKVKPHVFAYVQRRRAELSQEAGVTAEMVLTRMWLIATADPNELSTHRRVNCRHCFGTDHAYQWIDRQEWAKAVAAAKRDKVDPPLMDGGMGFDRTLRPHPKCPHCKGEGKGDVVFKDTSDLSPAGLAIYAGVKRTKDGLELKMVDQLAALTNVARHLGMFNDKLTLKGDEENPVLALISRVSGKTLGPTGD